MSEVYLYGNMNQYSTEYVMREIEAATESQDLTLRINSDGGDVMGSYGLISKFAEFQGTKKIKIDGKANSMALFFLCYANSEKEALDVSEFVLHRAAYASWYEKEYMTPESWAYLDKVNANLKKALINTIDVAKFEALKGVTINEVFSNDKRIDVVISAKEAKAIGLIDKIVNITPAKRTEINARTMSIAAQYEIAEIKVNPEIEIKPTSEIKIEKNKIMNIQELQAQHPALFAEVKQLGITAEKDRVGAWLVYADVDIDSVKKGIESNQNMTQTESAEFGRKLLAATSLKDLEAKSQKEVKTPEANSTEKTAEQKRLEDIEASIKSDLEQSVKRLNNN